MRAVERARGALLELDQQLGAVPTRTRRPARHTRRWSRPTSAWRACWPGGAPESLVQDAHARLAEPRGRFFDLLLTPAAPAL